MDARNYREVFYAAGLALIVPERSVWDTIIGGSTMLTTGDNLGLLSGGAQGEAHFTELLQFLRGIDGLVMPAVEDKDLTAPPGTVDGSRYIVAAVATGDWATHEKSVARYSSAASAWEFYVPKDGWAVWVRDENLVYRYDGSAWAAVHTPSADFLDIKEDYTTGDLDSEAEVISAMNAAAVAINDILAALRTYGTLV